MKNGQSGITTLTLDEVVRRYVGKDGITYETETGTGATMREGRIWEQKQHPPRAGALRGVPFRIGYRIRNAGG